MHTHLTDLQNMISMAFTSLPNPSVLIEDNEMDGCVWNVISINILCTYEPEMYGVIDTFANSFVQTTRLSQVSVEQ